MTHFSTKFTDFNDEYKKGKLNYSNQMNCKAINKFIGGNFYFYQDFNYITAVSKCKYSISETRNWLHYLDTISGDFLIGTDDIR